jgi:hypothetical protein
LAKIKPQGDKDMVKKSMAFMLGWFLIALAGCEIKTPEIHGVVLDAETKQPVEGAWIHFTIEVHTKTIAGGTTAYLRVEPPHTRTNEKGQFLIPANQFDTPSFPHGFGSELGRFGLIADTIDDRQGGVGVNMRDYFIKNQKDFGLASGGGMKWWVKNRINVTLLVKAREDLDNYEDYAAYLQGLYRYCSHGRAFVERPPVEGGCDKWELNFVIVKHERFLEKYRNPTLIENPPYGVTKFDKIIKYSTVFRHLAYLYKKGGEYKKSLNLFENAKKFDEKNGLSLSLVEYEKQISELQKLIKNGKN